jgi:hypothetical protein
MDGLVIDGAVVRPVFTVSDEDSCVCANEWCNWWRGNAYQLCFLNPAREWTDADIAFIARIMYCQDWRPRTGSRQ